MSKRELTWEEYRKTLNITEEEEEEIRLEMELIEAIITARKENKISQRDLSQLSGVKQPAIARIESRTTSPQIKTLIKLLRPIGYTIKVVPIEKKKFNS